ncbi:hypothetical protein R3P38DRAFT_2793614 [Favolaschia claudopus]|uniref:SANT domain-containing protein n=1 Tax=Favolaschia claudopus TaxID=2862362 RepID=A0AAW0ACH0_9AGAR
MPPERRSNRQRWAGVNLTHNPNTKTCAGYSLATIHANAATIPECVPGAGAFRKHGKQFDLISAAVSGKNSRQCVEQYYRLKRNGYDFKHRVRVLLYSFFAGSDHLQSRILCPPLDTVQVIPGSINDWTREECAEFVELLVHHGPDFAKIELGMRGKTLREVAYYYWKVYLGWP